MNNQLFSSLELQGEWLCDVEIQAAPGGPGRIDSPWGANMIDYIDGGEFEGPKLRGRVLPGGGDWPAFANDGTFSLRLDVRAVWQTDDDAKIYVQYHGFIVLPEVEGGFGDLASADPADYYFRSSPVFRPGDERYLWLNKTLCVGLGRFTPGGLG
jgi:hypothetical protein